MRKGRLVSAVALALATVKEDWLENAQDVDGWFVLDITP